MVRNSGKGGSGHKKLKNSVNSESNRELQFKEYGQDYAIIKDMLGSGRCNAICYSDNSERLCIIRGSMRRRRNCFIRKNDIVLVALRDFQDGKADIIHLYTDDDVRSLTSYEEITHKFVNASTQLQTYTQPDHKESDVLFEDI
jgi:translation initiation factor 1A